MSSQKKRKRDDITLQEEAQLKDNDLWAIKFHAENENFLNNILECPEIWKHPEIQYVRDFVDKVKNNPDQYPPRVGDLGALQPDLPGHDGLTDGFVTACAAGKDKNDASCPPTLQVIVKDSTYKVGYRKDPKRKFIDMTLLDGDSNTIHARLATHTTDVGRLLKLGSVIQLDLYNDLTYHLNGHSKIMPWLLISKFTIVGKDPLPLASEIKKALPMNREDPSASTDTAALSSTSATSAQSESATSAQSESSAVAASKADGSEEKCTEDNRLCSVYGTKFKLCVCDCMPVEDVDLDDIAEDCYFAGPVSEMEPNHKRNLLYWYYATNVYLICGAHNRKELPSCLVSKIRKLYPSPDGKIVGYKDYEHYVS